MHSLEFVCPNGLKSRRRAWQTYTPQQRELTERWFEKGAYQAPLIDRDNYVVLGELIVERAKALRLNQIAVQRIDHLSPDELRLYAIAAERMGKMGGYDEELLADELRELQALLDEPDFSMLGYDDGELDKLLGLADPLELDETEAEIDEDGQPITGPGDLWMAGPHRILCANALLEESYAELMDGELAQYTLSDVPYNLSHKTISTNEDLDDFQFAHGEMSPNEYTRFLTTAMRHANRVCEDGALLAFFISYHFLLELLRAGTIVFGRPKALVTWVKSQGGYGGLFRSQTEFVVYFKKGDAPYRDNVVLGKHGRNRTNAWHFEGMNSPSAERSQLLKLHATPKPVELLREAILDVTSRNGIVLDPFAGVGSLAIAAHSVERRAFMIEIEPKYVDASLRRVAKVLGLDAVRKSDGAKFSELDLHPLPGGL